MDGFAQAVGHDADKFLSIVGGELELAEKLRRWFTVPRVFRNAVYTSFVSH